MNFLYLFNGEYRQAPNQLDLVFEQWFGVDYLRVGETLLELSLKPIACALISFSDNKWSKEISKCMSLNAPNGLIIDAGALSQTKIIQSQNNKNLILTPHPGEAGSLLGISAEEVQLNREHSAIAIAEKYDASVVVLKGFNTLVYIKSEDKTFICENGGPELATGGTGDILAGIISALLAQNLPLKESCLLAVASHAKAGENFVEDVGEIGLNASSLIPMVRKILNK